MTVQGRISQLTAAAIAVTVLGLMTGGCGSTLNGSAIAASFVATPTAGATTSTPSSMSSSRTASPTVGSALSAGSPAPPSTGAAPSFSGDPTSGTWSAVVETGPGNGIPSPNGDLSVRFDHDQVCFVPVAGDRRCGPLAAGATPTFAAFSQDGADLLIVAGTATAAGV